MLFCAASNSIERSNQTAPHATVTLSKSCNSSLQNLFFLLIVSIFFYTFLPFFHLSFYIPVMMVSEFESIIMVDQVHRCFGSYLLVYSYVAVNQMTFTVLKTYKNVQFAAALYFYLKLDTIFILKLCFSFLLIQYKCYTGVIHTIASNKI